MNNNFTTIEATYRIVTPMFCSGGEPQKAELRLASFKGALRFWWRSLMWGKVSGINDLHKKEAALFGSSDQKVGQSKVRMQFSSVSLEEEKKVGTVFENGKLLGAHYLGYGVMNHKGILTRPMIPGGTFTVQLRLSPLLIDKQKLQVKNALVMLGTVGGLGSKSRKGFGSLTLMELKVNKETRELATYPAERIKEMTNSLGEGQSEWTAWSKQSRIVFVTSLKKRTTELLDQIGKEQVYYRSWGRKSERDFEHKVLGTTSQKNFPEDHDLSKGLNVTIQHPKRIAFGLPHNYGKGSHLAVEPANRDLERRASPLFLHIHQLDEKDNPIGIAVFLPSQFLPEDEKIKAFKRTVPLDTGKQFWDPINGYLDRLIKKDGATNKVQKDLQTEEITLG